MTNAELVRLNELRAAARGAAVRQPAELHGRLAQAARPEALRPAPAPVRLARPGRVRGDRRPTRTPRSLGLLKDWGIPVSPHNAVYDTIDEVIAHAERWADQRNTLDFQTDGLVVKVDDLGQRERLGTRSKSPRWVIAFKYEAEQAVTKIVGISVQVGKTGKLTPVADLTPVPLAGTTVKRASLHNADEIAPQGRPGRRHGRDPEGRRDHPPGRPRRGRGPRRRRRSPFDFPTHCPSCGAPVDREPRRGRLPLLEPPVGLPRAAQGVAPLVRPPRRDGHRRPGRQADRPARRPAAWSGAWPTSTGSTRRRSPTSSGWARSRPQNLVAALEASKTRSLDRFLTGLTIRHVGTRMRRGPRRAVRDARGAPRGDRSPSSRRSPRSARSSRRASTTSSRTPSNQQLLDDLAAVGVAPDAGPAAQPPARRPAACRQDVRPDRHPAQPHPPRGRGPDQAARRQGHRLGLEVDQLRPRRRRGRAASSRRPGSSASRSSTRPSSSGWRAWY